MKMVLLILAALSVPLALGYLGVLPGMVVLIAEVAILLIVAWWFDRGRDLERAPHSWTGTGQTSPPRWQTTPCTRRKRRSSVPRTGPPPTDASSRTT